MPRPNQDTARDEPGLADARVLEPVRPRLLRREDAASSALVPLDDPERELDGLREELARVFVEHPEARQLLSALTATLGAALAEPSPKLSSIFAAVDRLEAVMEGLFSKHDLWGS